VPDDLDALARLLTAPVGDMSDDDLRSAVQQSERIREASRRRTGRLLAEMHSRGMSWPAIARTTGIRQTTAYDWARIYLNED